ncbi:hypothetical protein LIER_25625 [Lithospermum erythrorhizon]|uniref:Uncharacterized protein n=1 Tax=Lithospermum erythrorhizon TaxID=34254 RepID=A0AAV3RBB4_LITER
MIKWPDGRANTSDVQDFKAGFPNQFDDDDDLMEWFGSTCCKAINVWNKLRGSFPQVWWWKVIWFNGHVPNDLKKAVNVLVRVSPTTVLGEGGELGG